MPLDAWTGDFLRRKKGWDDLVEDPGEFNNLWSDNTYTDLKTRLLLASFNSAMAATDKYCERMGPM